MPKILRVIVIAGGAVLAFVLLGMLAVWFMGGRALDRVYVLPAEPLAIPTDSASLAEGERLATLLGCTDCHGANLAGSMFIDALPFVSVQHGQFTDCHTPLFVFPCLTPSARKLRSPPLANAVLT